jgi:RNA polymerase primary sigma factor
MNFNKKQPVIDEEEFIKNPSDENRNKMVLHHEPLVHMVLKKYASFLDKNQYDDMVQEGMLGLLDAARRFDPKKNIRFPTYASWWVRSFIQNYLTGERSVKFGVVKNSAFERNKKAKKVPLLDCLSLDQSAYFDDEEGDMYNVIGSPVEPIEEKALESVWMDKINKAILPIISKSDLKKSIFYKRLMSDNPKTLKEIGDEYNLSKEAIRLNEIKILDELKKVLLLEDENILWDTSTPSQETHMEKE